VRLGLLSTISVAPCGYGQDPDGGARDRSDCDDRRIGERADRRRERRGADKYCQHGADGRAGHHGRQYGLAGWLVGGAGEAYEGSHGNSRIE